MNRPEFVSRHLRSDDDLTSFSSGRTELDLWLRESAHHAEAMRTGRTWVWTRDRAVVAYYTLAGHLLERQPLPAKVARGSPSLIPAVIVAKLALSRDLHGQGLGGLLLADALRRIISATDVVAARLVVVDAIDEGAGRFYERFGFSWVPATNRLVRKVSDIAADLEDSIRRPTHSAHSARR